MATLAYSPQGNFSGADVLSISTNDNGHTGGGALTDTDTVNITVNPVNDAPELTAPGMQSFLTEFDNLFTTPFTVSDVDAAAEDVQVDARQLKTAVGLFDQAIADGELHGAVLLLARRRKIILHQALGWRSAARLELHRPL